jgi:predicted KAP-like P-loop ATPase
MLLTDNETKVDLLNNEAIAATIIGLLRSRPEHPVTIGVHGDWGAGKSSVLEMIESGFEGQDDVLCLKFNGWRFQGFEDAKIALIEGIVTGLIEKRPVLGKAAGAVKDVFRRIDWLKVAKRAGGLAVTAFTGIPTPEQIGAILGSLENVLVDPAKLATKDNLTSVVDEMKAVLKSGETKNVPEEVEAFRKAFDRLLEEAGVKQLVVLIDDLDRCLPDTAIETLEAIRLFVFTAQTAFVVAADEGMIEYAVRKHFPELPESTGGRDYARSYLEKLIQVPFRIPPLGENETRIFVALLLIGAELGEENPSFVNLVSVARDRLRRPWASGPLDAAAVSTALGVEASHVGKALALSDQVGPILAGGTDGNPRQIKRFLNALLLRKMAADARGFGEAVNLPVLAKLMLAERFQPRLFDQIAAASATSPSGRCDDLVLLEAEATQDYTSERLPPKRRGTSPDEESVKLEVAKTSESILLGEWRSSKATVAWAQVRPPLADTDLRPYIFVARDRKDYFGAASAWGILRMW